MTEIDDEALDELERCAEAATDEDWEVIHGPGVTEIAAGTCNPWADEREVKKVIVTMRANPSPDAQHIAAADPPTGLALIKEVRRLREERDRYRKTLQKISKSRAGDFRTINRLTLHIVRLAEEALEDE